MVCRGLPLSALRILVVDELDELLSRGFRDLLYDLFDRAVASSPEQGIGVKKGATSIVFFVVVENGSEMARCCFRFLFSSLSFFFF